MDPYGLRRVELAQALSLGFCQVRTDSRTPTSFNAVLPLRMFVSEARQDTIAAITKWIAETVSFSVIDQDPADEGHERLGAISVVYFSVIG